MRGIGHTRAHSFGARPFERRGLKPFPTTEREPIGYAPAIPTTEAGGRGVMPSGGVRSVTSVNGTCQSRS